MAWVRLLLDILCASIALCNAVLSTVSTIDHPPNNTTTTVLQATPPPTPFQSSTVPCLWVFLFFLLGLGSIFDLQHKHNLVDIASLLLLLPSVAWIWTTSDTSSTDLHFHLYGNQLSLLRVSTFTSALSLRFIVSVLCCWESTATNGRTEQEQLGNTQTPSTDAVHGDYVALSSQIDDGEEVAHPTTTTHYSPEDHASAWSRFFFCWITPMLHRGYTQQRLTHQDLPDLAQQDVPHRVYSKFHKYWSQPSRPSLLATLHHLIFWRFYGSGLLLAGSMAAGFAQPLLLRALLVHLEDRVSGHDHSSNSESLTWTLQLAAALSIVSLLKSILAHQFWIHGIRCGMHTQLALSTHVLRASMYADHSVVGQEFDTGKLLNLLSTDSSRIVDTNVVPAFHWGTWGPAITLIVVITNLYSLVGIAAFSGIVATVLFSGLGVWIGTSIKKAAALTAAKRDVRATLTEQMLRSIRVIKSFSFEPIVEQDITNARNEEMQHQRWQQYLSMVSAAVSIVGPLLTTAVTFVWYSLAGGQLTASIAFASLAWFNVLRNSLQMIPWAYVATAGSLISIGRLEKFFNRARSGMERDRRVVAAKSRAKESKGGEEKTSHAASSVFELHNCTLGWAAPVEQNNDNGGGIDKDREQRDAIPVLEETACTVARGEFVCIMGDVGSGKSTLLSALCGHLKPLNGSRLYINSTDTYAYVGQQAWLRSTTVLENITMYGERNPINQSRLDAVISACLLGPDLIEFPNGLHTGVGSDGITLSGGQRQRIALARAVYSHRDCVLLDDVLSAVDATVRRHILNDCLVGMLKRFGKTIVLVTHDTTVTSHQEVDAVYLIQNRKLVRLKQKDRSGGSNGSNGSGVSNENENENVKGRMTEMPALKCRPSETKNEDKDKNNNDCNGAHNNSNTNPYLSNKHEGRLSCHTIWKYLNAVGRCSVAITVLLFLVGGALSIGQQWYLTVWVHDDGVVHRNTTNLSASFYSGRRIDNTSTAPSFNPTPSSPATQCCTNVIVYSSISGVIAVVAMSRVVVLTCGSLSAATKLHEAALHGILHAPLVVFSSVRTGVFMNRMLGDVSKIDSVLANAIVGLVTMVIQLVQIMGVVTFVAPPVLLLLPFLAYPYYIAAQYYRWSNRDLRRLMSSSRSPLLTQFGETLHGLTVVRAYRAEELTCCIYEQALSTNVRAYFSQWIANQWITVVLESIGVLIIGGTAIATAFTTGNGNSSLLGIVLTPGTAGMVLTFTFNLPGTLMWLVRNFTNMETELVAVERLSECIELIKEEQTGSGSGSSGGSRQTTPVLPRLVERGDLFTSSSSSSTTSSLLTGELRMNNVCMRYSDHTPNVLKGLTITIQPGSKVAVVGRTGAGKSSLFLALQRLYSFQGQIHVDGIPVHLVAPNNNANANGGSSTTLMDVRRAYAYVPQDPILFIGTVRSNLTFGMHHQNNSVPNDALLWSALARVSMEKTIREWPDQMDTAIIAQGENLSAGERQLLCLARALLCRARILLVDEGMSSVDEKTDRVAHNTLLGLDGCTVLSICHNLGSLDRFDKVIVMDAGEIVEFGSPTVLLTGKNGEEGEMLRELVNKD